ncbi:unnamed protein product, partial [Rotaria magnacalcarata]
KKCTATGKCYRCYKGDITVQTCTSSSESKDTFDHSHTGRVRDADFSSRKNIEGKILRPNKRGAFNSSSSTDKEDGKWNDVQIIHHMLFMMCTKQLRLISKQIIY